MIMADDDDTRLTAEINALRDTLVSKDREIADLRISNLFLETLFDGISEEIVVLDPNFTVKDVNRAFLRRYGLRKSEALGKKCYDLKRRANAPCHSGDASCPLVRSRDTGETVEMTVFHKNAKGDSKELFLLMYPIKVRGKRPRYFMEITRDVSENRALMRKLQDSERRFRSILDTATDAILSIDENHRIILFNDAAQKIFGYSREEVVGKNLNVLIPPKYGDHERYIRRFLDRRESEATGKTMSLTGLRKSGEEFPIELSISLTEMDGGIISTAIIRDITEHQQLEKKLLQSERLAAVGQAVAHVAHEIKSPLTVIGGFSNQIRMSLTGDRDRHKLELILEEVRRLERLVGNIGDFTKEYKLVKRPVDINVVIRDVLKIMAGFLPQEKYQFNECLSAGIGEIHCDPDKLKQVFINVISNGLEAMAKGGSIGVTTERLPQGIEVRISDEGIGIPSEDLEHVFEPFYTTRERGSGLGLSISYKIVEAHDGEIWAMSRPGSGTTLVIRLPEK
jgi:two-component system sensor kinase FixL